MKTFAKTFAVVALFSTSALAAEAEFHPSTYTTYKQHGPYDGSVRVLDTYPADERSYTEIGMVRIKTDNVNGYYDALDELKERAAKHGGTAIILDEDAKIFSEGGMTPRGTMPVNASATAVILDR